MLNGTKTGGWIGFTDFENNCVHGGSHFEKDQKETGALDPVIEKKKKNPQVSTGSRSGLKGSLGLPNGQILSWLWARDTGLLPLKSYLRMLVLCFLIHHS